MDEDEGGRQGIFKREALHSQRRAALGSIQINTAPAYWAVSPLAAAFAVPHSPMSLHRCRARSRWIEEHKENRSVTPRFDSPFENSGYSKKPKSGVSMESRSSASLRFSVQFVLVAIICFASALVAGQKAVAANKTYNPATETPPPPPPPVMLDTVTITGCSDCSSSSFDSFPLTISTFGLSIEPGEATILADVMAELSTQQRQHTSCVDNLLLAYEQTPSASPVSTGNASDGSVVRDANPLDIQVDIPTGGTFATSFAGRNGATGSDYNVPSGCKHPGIPVLGGDGVMG